MPFLDISVWEQNFQALMRQEKPGVKWSLKLDNSIFPNKVASGWTQFQQSAVAQFCCSSCYRSWASVQVKILCHIYLDTWKSQGQVLMRVFAQRCQKCSSSNFEVPEFSKESMMMVLERLAQHILERYFGHTPKKTPVIRGVRVGKPHDAANCERCALGYCCGKSSIGNKATPSKPPGSSPGSHSSPLQPPNGNGTAPELRDVGKGLLFIGVAVLFALAFRKAL